MDLRPKIRSVPLDRKAAKDLDQAEVGLGMILRPYQNEAGTSSRSLGLVLLSRISAAFRPLALRSDGRSRGTRTARR